MKICSVCKEERDLKDFRKRASSRDGLQSACKICQSKRGKEEYKTSPDRRSQIKRSNDSRRKALQAWVLQYLKEHPCVDCGETDVIVLDFDHVDPSQKTYTIGDMIRAPKSLLLLQKEVEKCVVRCANDHRRRTAEQFGWYRFTA